MPLSEVSLKWSGFESNMLNNLKYAFRDEDFSDVSLVCEGISVKSHKVVLSACSPLFKNIFAQNPHQFTVIILQDVSLFNLKTLLTFIYNGEVNVGQEHLSELLKAAENLKIRGLTTVAEDNGEFSANKHSQQESYEYPPMERNYTSQESEDSKQSYAGTPDIGGLIPKEEPPDLICVEAILNEGYTSENNMCYENVNQSLYMQNDHSIPDKAKTITKTGKIKKKKSKSTKRNNLYLPFVKDSVMCDIEASKENIVNGDDIENVGQSDGVLEALHEETVCDDESKIEQATTYVEDAGPKFPCPFCSRTYHTWGYRRRHVKSRHRVNRLSCKMCEENTSSQSLWFDHVVHRHAVDRAEARKSLVILVEAHAVLTCTSPPSPAHLLTDFQKERDMDDESLMI